MDLRNTVVSSGAFPIDGTSIKVEVTNQLWSASASIGTTSSIHQTATKHSLSNRSMIGCDQIWWNDFMVTKRGGIKERDWQFELGRCSLLSLTLAVAGWNMYWQAQTLWALARIVLEQIA